MQGFGTAYRVEVNPRLPSRLARLEELAGNLWYSWDRPTRELFAHLHPELWDATGQNPKAFLRQVDEQRLLDAVDDPVFCANLNRVLSAYDTYHAEPLGREDAHGLRRDDLVAYFCAEFGFHESLPIYSGGLGILAGDHCKAASDMRLPLVAVGLLYRQGYFFQTIDGEGNQQANYADSNFDELPVAPVRDRDGGELRIRVDLPGRTLSMRVWKAQAGHVPLYLLDTDVAENGERDRGITHRLYGGDGDVRLDQEIVLGIGGVRVLDALGIAPTVWHMNEGHAAFLVLERVRQRMKQGVDFAAALESVAVSTVFTTHTAVPAGHDHFPEKSIAAYFDAYARDAGIDIESLLALGRQRNAGDFDMTALAVRGSRFQNGVSRIHGEVSANMLRDMWPQLSVEESPIGHVANGVHVPTFLSPEWVGVFDRFLGPGWNQRMHEPATWEAIDELPDHIFWSVHQYLKSTMLEVVRQRIREQHFRNQGSEAQLDRLLQYANPYDPNVLTIGFARRFATYKRATLLFHDVDWLDEILTKPKHPVVFIFAGRAHPADLPGQELIHRVADIARMPRFEGKILLVEGYDLRLARVLVSGVDVWLNNPVHPLEASGTSGMKAGMNGVINLSVLDGWWEDGYERDNGWAIKPAAETLDQAHRDSEEARSLYELLQEQVIPLYYHRGAAGYSREWIRMAKRSIATILPHYDAARMVSEYVSRFYVPASLRGRRYADHEFGDAKRVAAWKARVRAAWPGVRLRRLDAPRRRMQFGDSMQVELGVALNGLAADDLVVEMLLMAPNPGGAPQEPQRHRFAPAGRLEGDEHRHVLDIRPEMCGKLEYRIRVYPWHELLSHPFELGLMLWN